jgi:hypothetical protein
MRRGPIDSATLVRGARARTHTEAPPPLPPQPATAVTTAIAATATAAPRIGRGGRVTRLSVKVDPLLVRGSVHCRHSPEQWRPWLEAERARRPEYIGALERAYLTAPWPVEIVELPSYEGGGYRLLGDGHHRTAMAVCAGLREIPVEVLYRR